ncbi:hypothetical protein [Pseudanabaena sp. PCC 6802]|nr:hypothetical protein [Pseudanabaena sp. PCC 6802]
MNQGEQSAKQAVLKIAPPCDRPEICVGILPKRSQSDRYVLV